MLEDGRITAIASHDELLGNSPTYQRLYQLQFMDLPEPQIFDPMAQQSSPETPQCEPALSSKAGE